MPNQLPPYVCVTCGVRNVKLWRLWNTFLDHQELFCAKCGSKPGTKVDNNGQSVTFFGDFECPPTDTLTHPEYGSLAPAIPTKENDTYWGYSSVPQDLVEWWLNLPTYEVEPVEFRSIEGLTNE